MMQSEPASAKMVAKRAGVSAMTVSRVFNHSPRVQARTRAKVLAAAEALGYQPDPNISRLMEQVRSHRERGTRAVLAVIRDDLTERNVHGAGYNYVTLEDIQKRAEGVGYGVEEFWLKQDGLRPGRLGSILRARGIEGVIVSPASPKHHSAKLDYKRFASACFGFGLTSPRLHCISTDMMEGIINAASTLERRGYRRIGMAISEWINLRSNNTYSGAMLHYQQRIPASHRVPMLILSHNLLKLNRDAFCEWMQAERPDAVISFHDYVPEWIAGLGLRIPEDVGFVVHDWLPTMAGFAGIDHRRPNIAAAAVDIVTRQLHHNEIGIPEVRYQVLVSSTWREGASIRPPV